MTQALIPIVNKIQEAFAQVRIPHKLDLPQIAVVGSQSAGKSSVIENIVGRDFLPRGSGIVTRRPLILQLTNLPIPHADDGSPAVMPTPWAEFAHQPGRKFFDFREVRAEIAAETDRETGTGKAVSAKPIILKVYAADVVNLTLVDLPGLTKVPVGDQPPDIEVQIRAMVLEFINKPACIILAVSPANVDIANSDALKLAREVDPEGVRTIGVLTKLDLMDKGTDAREILEGKAYPLRRGFIGIVNRSQQAIETMVDIGKALRDEEDFFQTHPVYRSLASRCGTAYLARTLNAILLAHIRETLPELRSKISDLIVQTEGVLTHLGGDSDERSRGGLLLQLLAEFERGVIAAIDGSNSSVSYTELKGGARISYIFSEAFVPYLQRLNPTEGLQEEHIRTAICNSKGARNGLFIPEAAFESLIHRQIARLEDPGLRCCDHVFEELAAICEAQAQQFNRFPDLRVQVGEFCIALLRRYMPALRGFVSSLVAIELAHVNTHHPDFFGGGNVFEKLMTGDPAAVIGPGGTPPMAPTGAVAPGGTAPIPPAAPVAVGTMPPSGRVVASGAVGPTGGFAGTGPVATMRDAAALSAQSALVTRFEDVPSVLRHVGTMSATERKETEVIKILIKTYFDIVRKTFADQVPKAVVHFLINKLKGELHGELVSTFYKEELFAILLRESDDISAKRKAARAMLQCLRQAQGTLAEVKDARVA